MKRILITGASAGIGRAAAEVLLAEGFEVLAVARRQDRLESWADSLPDLLRKRLIVARLDVNSDSQMSHFLETHSEWLSKLDVLFNNAGLALGVDRLQDSDPLEIQSVVNTNVLSLLKLTRAVLPKMIARRSGLVVNMGSIAGITPYVGGTVYCATKAAVHMITDCLRLDLGGTGVRVSTLAPGRVETEFSQVRFRGDQSLAAKVYKGLRPLQAADIAEALRWIVSLPDHVCIQELVVMPTDQPSATTLAPLGDSKS